MVSPIGIMSTAKNKDNAQQFVDFMISAVAQNYFVNSTREYPLIDGVKQHPMLTPLADITKANISLSDLSDIQGSVKLLQEAGALPK
jgi:iron(III) transport system substrate-binding protein